MALKIPGQGDLAVVSAEAAAVAARYEGCEILIGWPEPLVILRDGRSVLYAEGDVVHFGCLSLDHNTSIERTGYQYLGDTGCEVSVVLAITAEDKQRHQMLGPGERTGVGAYDVEHDHSYDPSDRPSGARHHGYYLRVRRIDSAPPPAIADDGVPNPLDVVTPEELVELARSRALLEADEALETETRVLSQLLSRYEGPRQALEEALADVRPAHNHLSRVGEAVVATSAWLQRGDHGEPVFGTATVRLDPVGGLHIDRAQKGVASGRLRRHVPPDSPAR